MQEIRVQNWENAVYYGYEAQSLQLVEECAELIQAVNKYRRAGTNLGEAVEESKAAALDNLVEELADVEIMIDQIKYLLKIPAKDIDAVKVFKVKRTRERIESRG